MPTQIFLSRGDNAPTMTTAELCRKLSDELSLPCRAENVESDKHFVFGEIGISVMLVFDENTKPMAATVEIPHSAQTTHVTKVFHGFEEWGWEF